MPRSYIRGVQIGLEQITYANVKSNTLTTLQVSGYGLSDAAKFATGVVITRLLASQAVTTPKIALGAVGSTAIGTNAVQSSHITGSAVTSNKIAAAAVTNDKLATNSVNSLQITASAVTEAKIAAGAVSNSKLATNSVNSLQITAAAVTEVKIANDAVTTNKIQNNAVTNSKLAVGSVGATAIANYAVEAQHLATAAKTAVVDSRIVDISAFNVKKFTLGGSVAFVGLPQASAPSGPVLNATGVTSGTVLNVVAGGNPLAVKEAVAGVSPIIGSTVEYLEGLPANVGALCAASTNEQVQIDVGGGDYRKIYASLELSAAGSFNASFNGTTNKAYLKFFYINNSGVATTINLPAGDYQFFYGRRYKLGQLPPRILQGAQAIVDNVAAADVTLQQAYQNTLSDPEITTNATRGAINIQRGTGDAALLQLDNNSVSINSGADIAALTLSGGTTNSGAGASIGVKIDSGYDVGLQVTGSLGIKAHGGMQLTGNAQVGGNIVPIGDNLHELGSNAARFTTGHFAQAVKVGTSTTRIYPELVSLAVESAPGGIYVDSKNGQLVYMFIGATAGVDPMGNINNVSSGLAYNPASDHATFVFGHVYGAAPGTDRIIMEASSAENSIQINTVGGTASRIKLLSTDITNSLTFSDIAGAVNSSLGLKIDTFANDLLLTGAAVKVDTVLQSKGGEWSITKQGGNTKIASSNDLLVTASALKVDTVIQDKDGNYAIYKAGTAAFLGTAKGVIGTLRVSPVAINRDGKKFPAAASIKLPANPTGAIRNVGLMVTGVSGSMLIVGGANPAYANIIGVAHNDINGTGQVSFSIGDLEGTPKNVAAIAATKNSLAIDAVTAAVRLGVNNKPFLRAEPTGATLVVGGGNGAGWGSDIKIHPSGTLTLTTTGGSIRLADTNKVGSTYTNSYLPLSSAQAEWNTFVTNFGQVSLINAINQALSLGADDLQEAYNNTPTENVTGVGSASRLIRIAANSPVLVTGLSRQYALVVGGTANVKNVHSSLKMFDNIVALQGTGSGVFSAVQNTKSGSRGGFGILYPTAANLTLAAISAGAAFGAANSSLDLGMNTAQTYSMVQAYAFPGQFGYFQLNNPSNPNNNTPNWMVKVLAGGSLTETFAVTGVQKLLLTGGSKQQVVFSSPTSGYTSTIWATGASQNLKLNATNKLMLAAATNIEAQADVLPSADNTLDLGSPAARFATGYFGNAVKVGSSTTTISPTSVSVVAPAGAIGLMAVGRNASGASVTLFAAPGTNQGLAGLAYRSVTGVNHIALNDNAGTGERHLRIYNATGVMVSEFGVTGAGSHATLKLNAATENAISSTTTDLKISASANDILLTGASVKVDTTIGDKTQANWSITTGGTAAAVKVTAQKFVNAANEKVGSVERAAWLIGTNGVQVLDLSDAALQGSLSIGSLTGASASQFTKNYMVSLNGQVLLNETAFRADHTTVTNDVARGTNSPAGNDKKLYFGFQLQSGDVVQVISLAPLDV